MSIGLMLLIMQTLIMPETMIDMVLGFKEMVSSVKMQILSYRKEIKLC